MNSLYAQEDALEAFDWLVYHDCFQLIDENESVNDINVQLDDDDEKKEIENLAL